MKIYVSYNQTIMELKHSGTTWGSWGSTLLQSDHNGIETGGTEG